MVARELSAFTGRGEGDDRLGEYLARIPESCVLILYVQGKADARKKLYQAVKKHGTVVSFQPMDEAELNRWLVRTAKGMGKELSLGDAAYLAFLVGSDAATLKTELEKLSALTGERAEITPGGHGRPSAPGPWSARCSRWWTRWWRARRAGPSR